MHNGEGERKINGASQVVETHLIGPSQPSFNALCQPFPFGSPPQAAEHLRLNIDGNYTPSGPNHARQGQGEESHPRARLKYRNPISNERPEHFLGTLR
jgi:hypothetical protein